MDTKSTLLNGDLEEAYVEQPKGFTKKGEEKSICR
jgi:hypothetical protein